MARGWWTLEFTGVEKLNDADLENIAKLIIEGFNSGEIVQEKSLLNCENPDYPEAHILTDFEEEEIEGGCHHNCSADFDHGQWFVSCLDCGAQWSVCDAVDKDGEDYFQFEKISIGDEFCFSKEE